MSERQELRFASPFTADVARESLHEALRDDPVPAERLCLIEVFIRGLQAFGWIKSCGAMRQVVLQSPTVFDSERGSGQHSEAPRHPQRDHSGH